MANKIYIVAAEGNMLEHARINGGLYANVGQTTREVSERLHDDDYRRKNSGRRWQILLSQEVGDSLTDKQIHPLLKSHPGVSWDPDCDNTEQFLFKDDVGDGVIARQIVRGILQQVCLPLLQAELSRLQAAMAKAETELEERTQIIRDLASGEIVQEVMRRLEQTDDRALQLENEVARLTDDLQDAFSENEKLQQELSDVSSKADKNYLERIDLLRQAVELKNVEVQTTKKELSYVRDAYTRRSSQFDLMLEKTQSDLTRARHELCDAHDNLNKMTLGATAAGVLALLLLGIGCWKLWKTNDEIEQLQSQVAGYQEALTTETLKNNRLKLKLVDASHSVGVTSPSQGQKHKDRQALPPVPLNSDNLVRYNELYTLLGKERADAYARGVAAVEKDMTGAASYAIQHSNPIDPDVNPDAAGVVILDAGVLVTLINEQVVSSATACLLLKTKTTSKYHVTASMGILPDGHIGYIKVQDQSGDPQLVAECILPALKSVQIDPPGVNLLGTYAADFNIKVTDE